MLLVEAIFMAEASNTYSVSHNTTIVRCNDQTASSNVRCFDTTALSCVIERV